VKVHYDGYDSKIYVRSLGRNGPVFRTLACLRSMEVSHDTLDLTSASGPMHVAGPSRIDLHLISYGSDNNPVADYPELPLAERLALAVLDGDDSAVYPLIDAFFESRNK
jgi:hypothetical protein